MKKENQFHSKIYKNPLLYLVLLLIFLVAGLWIYMEKRIPAGSRQASLSLEETENSDTAETPDGIDSRDDIGAPDAKETTDAAEITDATESSSNPSTDSMNPWLENAESLLADLTGKNSENYADSELKPLESQIRSLTDIPGETWSVYVKNLRTDQEICIGNHPMYAASLIKLFVLEYWAEKLADGTYDYQSDLFPSEAALKNRLADMIEVSDNDAFNELVVELSADHTFADGCRVMNEYLMEKGYENTGIFHTLHPTYFSRIAISDEENHTSVSDCGRLLERIYQGDKTGDKASRLMLELMLRQESTYKIPAGLPGGTRVANKTGETDTREQDVAIVFGPETDFILCVMNSDVHEVGDAMDVVRSIAATSYYTLNPKEEVTVNSRYYKK